MTRPSSERETTFRYAADEDHVSIFTAHTPTARKLERFGYAPYKVSTQGNEPVGWFFRVRDADGNLQMPRLARAGKTGNGRVPATSGDGPTLSA